MYLKNPLFSRDLWISDISAELIDDMLYKVRSQCGHFEFDMIITALGINYLIYNCLTAHMREQRMLYLSKEMRFYSNEEEGPDA